MKERKALTQCNNCKTVFIDENPQIDARLYKPNGKESEMIRISVTLDGKHYDFWACSNCNTDDYFEDL